jgi:CDGSH-type Zn-finger protein
MDESQAGQRSYEPRGAAAGRQRSAGDAVVTVYENGPLILRGRFLLTAQDGQLIRAGRRTVALCRCGRSALKPFCDGSHVRSGFRAPGRATGHRAEAEAEAERGDGGGGAGQPLPGVADAAAQPAAQGQPATD